MIQADAGASQLVLRRVSAVANFASLGTELASFCEELMGTLADADFPGAVVPALGVDGELRLLVAAGSVSDWRKLRPVLQAFAGPTLTSFDGVPAELPPHDSVASAIIEALPVVTSIMRLPAEHKARVASLRAIKRARETLARAPDLQRAAREPTSWMLARFQDCLNVGNRAGARALLSQLNSELRLDALNLQFLEVHLLATFGEWDRIVELPSFSKLCITRRTPAMTAMLLEAIYRVHVSAAFEAHDAVMTQANYETSARTLVQPMLTVPVPKTLSDAGWRLYGLEVRVSPSRKDIIKALNGRDDALGWLAELLRPSQRNDAGGDIVPGTLLDQARRALKQVDEVAGVDVVADAVAALAKLSPTELETLKTSAPFRAAFEAVDEEAVEQVPSSWIEWLARAQDPTFTMALEIARFGKDEWAIDAAVADPVAVSQFVAGLDRALNDEISSERVSQALPYLTAWLNRDPDFPRPGLARIYSSVLTLFALGGRSKTTYESSQILIHAVLQCGLDAPAYRSLIADIDELSGQGLGLDMVYWQFEVVEEFMKASAPDSAAREAFLHRGLARTVPLFSRLSSLQRSAVARLAAELGWTLDKLGVDPRETSPPQTFGALLDGKHVAIYSLTESSSRQAKDALSESAPTAIVDCNADHGGSARLRALAENADIFVVAWLSAKHAATDFIRAHRGDRTLIYAQGRGFSSILRALEEHLSVRTH